ncbi:YtxH domain-containing protein [Risungbinella massiliensis]|uniref:YtxH domain-containing protein n=1 Tax=Risungbinella massiliensis TaxID=1329796 RepID=UPI00069C9291|nr:YtxH domain-containing protein [Risungbinella massiliensis]
MSQNSGGKDFLLGVFLGAAIGAVTALLTAPKSGRELRQDLQEGYEVAKERSSLVAQNVRETATGVAGRVNDVKDKVQAKWIEIRSREEEDVRIEPMEVVYKSDFSNQTGVESKSQEK